MKKLVILLLALVMALALGLTGCTNGDDATKTEDPAEVEQEGEEITIKFLHRWPDEPYATFFEEVAANYEAMNPGINIEVQAIANDPFKEKIKVVLGTDEAPDVFFSWPGEFTNRFIREDKVMDLTEAMEGYAEDTYLESQLAPFIIDGKIYGAPVRLDGKVFVYNKALFDQAGVEVPNTWEEFITVCEKLDAAGITPIAFGNIAPWAVSHYIGTLNQKIVGDDIYDAYDPEVGDFSNSGFVTALEEFQRIVPYFNANSNGIKHAEAKESWINGSAAMFYIEIVEVPEIEKNASEEFLSNMGVFKFPEYEGGAGDQDMLTGYPEGFVCSSTTKYPEETVAFFKYLTGTEVGLKEIQDIGWLNGTKGIDAEGVVSETSYGCMQIVFESSGLVNWLDSGMHAEVTDKYLTNLQKIIDGVITPQEAIDEVQEVAKKVADGF